MPTIMADDRDLAFLAALQLGDAFLPTGAYTLSQGLESMVQRGWVANALDLEEALRSYLADQLAPADVVAAVNAHRAAAAGDLGEVMMIDHYLDALKLARESREGSRRTGRNLLQTLTSWPAMGGQVAKDVGEPGRSSRALALVDYREAIDAGEAPGHHAVVLGVVGQAEGLSARESALVFLHASLVGMLGAALRLMRLDHLTAQAILARLRPGLSDLVKDYESRPWCAMRAFGPQLDVASMIHERARVRLFSS